MTTDKCPDCQVEPGQPHLDGCDVARCLTNGGQRLMCAGPDGDDLVVPDPTSPEVHEVDIGSGPIRIRGVKVHLPKCADCGQDIWTGEWPGTMECREYGWWVRWENPAPGERYGKWVPTTEDDPSSVPNGSRLIAECVWDRDLKRHVRREAAPPTTTLMDAVRARNIEALKNRG